MAAGRGPFWEKLIRLLSAILVLDKFFVFFMGERATAREWGSQGQCLVAL